jgi:exopolysaccharide biosynthesis polyprenyl glycosylphosphotransferase
MAHRDSLGLRALLLLSDITLALLVPSTLSMVRFGPGWLATWREMVPDPASALLLFTTVWIVALWSQGLYRLRSRWSFRSEVRAIVQVTSWLAVLTFAILYLLRLPDVSRVVVLFLFPILAAGSIAARAGLRWGVLSARRRGAVHNLLVLGTNAEGRTFATQIEHHLELGLHVEGFLGPDPAGSLPWPYLGPLDRLADVMHERVIDEVAVCLPDTDRADRDEAVGLSIAEGKVVRIPLPTPEVQGAEAHLEDLDGRPLLSLSGRPDHTVGLTVKRAIDIVGAAGGLLLLSPLLMAVSMAILCVDGRPVIFRQTRAGLHGRRFRIVKFRTMTRDADAQRAALRAHNEVKGNAAFKMTDDPRVTPMGRWLRRTSVDELPQLWNVLRGDMSLVGPRPHPLDDLAGYHSWHRKRLSMRPGITGLWQVRSRRDDDFDQWVKRDLEYIDHWSLLLDLRLLISTIPAVLRSEGR